MACNIDIYNGEKYDPAKHYAREIFWSDGRLYYFGLLYNDNGCVVGDFNADTAQEAECALGVEFDFN